MKIFLKMWTDEELSRIDLEGLLEYAIKSKLARTLSNTKSVCEKQGVPFDITVEDLVPYPLTCPVLGLPINWMNTGSSSNDSPSLDRMQPDKGYVRGNVQIISSKANRLKNNGSIDDFQRIVEYMKKGGRDYESQGVPVDG